MDADDAQDLLQNAQAGDSAAWATLYLRLYPRLLAFAASRLGDVEAGRDAVAETMARAVAAKAGMGRRVASFDAWVFGILRHVVSDIVRQAGRARAVAPDRPSDDVADGVVLADEHELVRRAFRALRPLDRDLLELRVIGGLSIEEVASVLHKRPGTVRTAQSRALQRLRASLKDLDDGQ